MAEARRRDEWSRTSSIMALLANIHRDPRRRRTAFAPADFDPFAPQSQPAVNAVGIDAFRAAFLDGSRP